MPWWTGQSGPSTPLDRPPSGPAPSSNVWHSRPWSRSLATPSRGRPPPRPPPPERRARPARGQRPRTHRALAPRPPRPGRSPWPPGRRLDDLVRVGGANSTSRPKSQSSSTEAGEVGLQSSPASYVGHRRLGRGLVRDRFDHEAPQAAGVVDVQGGDGRSPQVHEVDQLAAGELGWEVEAVRRGADPSHGAIAERGDEGRRRRRAPRRGRPGRAGARRARRRRRPRCAARARRPRGRPALGRYASPPTTRRTMTRPKVAETSKSPVPKSTTPSVTSDGQPPNEDTASKRTRAVDRVPGRVTDRRDRHHAVPGVARAPDQDGRRHQDRRAHPTPKPHGGECPPAPAGASPPRCRPACSPRVPRCTPRGARTGQAIRWSGRQRLVVPRSTAIWAPVTLRASSLARYATVPEMSSGGIIS